MDQITNSLKRKCNIDECSSSKKVKTRNEEKKCIICSNILNKIPILELKCRHYIHIYCVLYEEIKNFIYIDTFLCGICNTKNKITIPISNKKNILQLVNIYHEVYTNILKYCGLTGRAFYEYKRNIFYIITKKIGKLLDCRIEFLDNIHNEFIIKANYIIQEDLLITKFEILKL